MPKKKMEEEELEEFFEANEHNIESASMERDYSDRKILVMDHNPETCENTRDVLAELLTGAYVDLADTMEKGEIMLDENDYDTAVVDLRTEEVSKSEFVKKVNNSDLVLIALTYEQLSLSDERSRFKLEPLRKLFEFEKAKPATN